MRAIQSDHYATIQLLKEEITSPASKQKPAPVPAPLSSSQISSLTRLEFGLSSPIPLVLSSHQIDPSASAGAGAYARDGASASAGAGAGAGESYLCPLPGHYQPMEQSMPPLSTEVLSSPQSPPPPSSPPPLPSPAIVGESNFHHYDNLINLVNHNYQTP